MGGITGGMAGRMHEHYRHDEAGGREGPTNVSEDDDGGKAVSIEKQEHPPDRTSLRAAVSLRSIPLKSIYADDILMGVGLPE